MLKKVSLFINKKFQSTADAESIRNAQSRAYEISSEILIASCGMNVRDPHIQSEALDKYALNQNAYIFQADFVSLCRFAVRLEILIGVSDDNHTTIDVSMFGKKAKHLWHIKCRVLPEGGIL